MTLFIDDEKDPKWFGLKPDEVSWARSFDEGIRLAKQTKPTTIYLDHDLGDVRKDGSILLQILIAQGIKPDTVFIISWNPAGRKRIQAVCIDHNIRYHLWRF